MRRPFLPPPVIGLLCLLAMWLVSRQVSAWQVEPPLRPVLAGLLVIIGGAIDAVSVAAFFRARTTINPLAPERVAELVVTGLYRYSRNPMYLGLLLILCGAAVWFAQPLNLLVLAAFVWLMNTLQIKPEEAALAGKFGDRYRDYCRRVRRWI